MTVRLTAEGDWLRFVGMTYELDIKLCAYRPRQASPSSQVLDPFGMHSEADQASPAEAGMLQSHKLDKHSL